MNVFDLLGYTSSKQYPILSKTSEGIYALIKAGGGTTYTGTVLETATGSDTLLAKTVFYANVTDLATATDAVVAGFLYLGAVAESATATDSLSSIKAIVATIVELAAGTDALATRLIAKSVLAETATASDVTSAKARFRGAIAEAATANDVISALKGYFVYVAETAAATDAVSVKGVFRAAIAETAAATELVRSYLTAVGRVLETAAATEQVNALRRMVAQILESGAGTDSYAARYVSRPLVQELATATDALTAPGSKYKAPIQEFATLLEALNAKATFRSSTTDTSTITDANSAKFSPYARIVELATGTETVQAKMRFSARAVESASITDLARVAPSTFNAIALASAAAVDNFNPAGSIYNVTIPESATIVSSLIGGYLWNLINDEQPVDWGNVLNAQTSSWNTINDSQDLTWNLVQQTNPFDVVSAWGSSATNGTVVIQPLYNGVSYAYGTPNNLWTLLNFPVSGLRQVTFVNGKFYAYSLAVTSSQASRLYSSVDGKTWTRVITPANGAVSVVFGNGAQLLIKQSQLYVSSDDGATWLPTNLPTTAASGAGSALWNGSFYIYNTGRSVYISYDGVDWVRKTGILSNISHSNITQNSTGYLASMASAIFGTQRYGSIYYSPDGLVWNYLSNLPYAVAWQLGNVFSFGDMFVAASEKTTSTAYQTDTTYWIIDPILGKYTKLSDLVGRYIQYDNPYSNFNVTKFGGVYIVPLYYGAGPSPRDAVAVTSDFVNFEYQTLDKWGTIDDTQPSGWQNTNTL